MFEVDCKNCITRPTALCRFHGEDAGKMQLRS
jgi:hypothetical protein